ncbi:Urease [Pyricularia oryzae]|nr:Urease [Pyricularia oryzae]
MHLVPRELDKLVITQLGHLAQRRLARGVKLNHSEATALITCVLQELIRDGAHTVSDLMSLGATMLGRRHVMPSVCSTLHEIQVEGTFPSGTYLVTVHNPIATDDGDLMRALYGSFLPVPDADLFSMPELEDYEPERQPGAVVAVKGVVELNKGRRRRRLRVVSKGIGRCRWAATTTLLRRMHSSSLTVARLMASALTSQPARRSVSSPAMPRRSPSSRSEDPRPSAAGTGLRTVMWTTRAWRSSFKAVKVKDSRMSRRLSGTMRT